MGSWDKAPEGFEEFDDIWNPPHRIVCNSPWARRTIWDCDTKSTEIITGERHDHLTGAEVAACYAAAHDTARGIEVWPCSWLLEGRYDDGSKFTYECGAPTRYTSDRGAFECVAGHSHVPADVRWEEGWDYAGDRGEAEGLARNGTVPVAMDGSAFPW